MWFDERKEANAIAAHDKFDDIYDAAIVAFKRQRESLISSPTQTPTATKEKQENGWIKTADRPPTKEDGDAKGKVIWGDPHYGYNLGFWHSSMNYRYWMPIPPVPKD